MTRFCVVLDVDDTLYLERDYVASGFRAVSRHLDRTRGVQGFYERAWSLFEAGVRGRIFDVALEQIGHPASSRLVGELVEVYRAHPPEISLAADARDAIQAWVTRGYALAAITDGPVVSQRGKVTALQLQRWLAPIVVTGELGEGFSKPHPRAFEHIQEHHGVAGTSLVYVGDNPAKDFQAPHSLGWRTVRIRRPGSLHEAVPSGPLATREVTSLAELDDPFAAGSPAT